MKLIIAGGRDYQLTADDYARLDLIDDLVTEVVSGGARGADTCGEEWARRHKLPLTRFPADWDTHGKAAGMIRNRTMAQHADALAVFPGGRGTDNMVQVAKRFDLTIFDYR